MEDHILDYIDEETSKNKIGIQNWISIILLWIGIASSINNGLVTEIGTIIAIGMLLLATLVSYLNWKVGVRITLLILFIGALGLISFYPITYKIGFSIGWLNIGFEIISLTIGLIHYFTNYEELSWIFKDLIRPSEETAIAESRSRINSFKSKFSNKSINELKQIVESNKFTPEAIEASKELIRENEKLN